MVVFTDKRELIPIIVDRFKNKELCIMNLSSYYSGYLDVTPLITGISPINNTGMPTNIFVDSVDFDMQYAMALTNNMVMYECMMQIVFRSYEGQLVIILVSRDPYRDAVMESLIKYIQQTYGHNCWIVEDIDDVICLEEQSFGPFGIAYMEDHIRQYNDLYSKGQVQNLLQPINIE
jgi:hypothetical protein